MNIKSSKYVKVAICIILAVILGVLAHNFIIGLISGILIFAVGMIKLPEKLSKAIGFPILIMIISPLFFFCVTEVLNQHYPWNTFAYSFIFNILFYLSFECIAYALSGNIVIGCYIASGFSFVVAVINYFVRIYKDAPFNLYDIFSVRTLFNVLDGGMELSTDWILAVGALAYILYWMVLAKFFRYNKGNKKVNVAARIVSGAYVIVLYILVFALGIFDRFGIDSTIYHAAEKNGFVVQFIQSYRDSKLTEPENYDIQHIDELASKYKIENQTGNDELPNVIVIMNESFADMSYLGDFQTDMEVLEYYHGLTENTVKGYALSSVYGGNTANSEWEFLTGNSMLFMPTGCIPYQIYLNTDTQSLTNIFEEMGYSSAAFHPYESTGWSRKQAWNHLGFDETFFVEDYDTANEDNLINDKITDLANYKRILEYIDSRESDNPLFVFNVTMQNHTGGYYDAEEQLGYKVHLQGEYADSYNYLEGYLTLMHESDQAFGWLINELSKRDEKYVVMMFGDHQVSFGVDDTFTESILGKSIQGLTQKERENLYTVPYIVWANYDIDSKVVEERTSINYLRETLLETMGIEGSAYDQFLRDCRRQYPAMNALGTFDKNGEFYEMSQIDMGDTDNILSDYWNLQYNSMFEQDNYCKDMFELGGGDEAQGH